MGEVSVQVTEPQRRPVRRPGPSQIKMYGFCHLFRAMMPVNDPNTQRSPRPGLFFFSVYCYCLLFS